MLALAFIKWWYGPGWYQAIGTLPEHLRRTYYGLSVPLLARTLVAPWRRIVSSGGGSLDERLRALIDNGLSRMIGLIVRLLTLAAAGLLAGGWIIIAALRLGLWPLLPPGAIILLVWGMR